MQRHRRETDRLAPAGAAPTVEGPAERSLDIPTYGHKTKKSGEVRKMSSQVCSERVLTMFTDPPWPNAQAGQGNRSCLAMSQLSQGWQHQE